MRTTIKILILAMIAMATTITSCSKDGADGAIGPAGQNGTNGQDGEDGNANVRAFIYDMSEKTGVPMEQNIPELTQDVLDNDLVLAYLKADEWEQFQPIPSTHMIGLSLNVVVNLEVGKYELYFSRDADVSGWITMEPGRLSSLKIIIAKSSSVAGKSGRINVRTQLKKAGVDINNYYAVMDYFGLEY